MRIAEGCKQGTDEQHGRNVADEIGEDKHGSTDGEKLRGDGAFQSGLEELNEIRGGAGVFESLHDYKKPREEEKQFPTDAMVDVFRFDASDDENERGDGRSGERK